MQTDKINHASGQQQKLKGSATLEVLGHSHSTADGLWQKQLVELGKSQTTAHEGLFARLL
ncbi:hypothetical protein [Planctobacterium marinum]|uniref:Uncharacterized protein n=1 Tax=Planctobacterium marinum TaxID=1631968 RepID=A0AA48HLN1_9ALTE|nr:hypothetical protein MACH26_02730 [Planctobacterium marinum]